MLRPLRHLSQLLLLLNQRTHHLDLLLIARKLTPCYQGRRLCEHAGIPSASASSRVIDSFL